jgi:hypothetical protein
MALLFTATIALFAGNSGNIIYLKGESLIFPKFYWLIFIPLVIVIVYIWKVGTQNGNAKGNC